METRARNSKKKANVQKPFTGGLFKNIFFYLFLLFIVYTIFMSLSFQTGPEKKPLGDVLRMVNDGKVRDITVSGDKIEVLLKDGSKFTTEKESGVSFDEVLANNKVDINKISGEYKVEHRVSFDQIITPIITFGFPLLILFFIFRQMRGASGDILSFGKTRARLFKKGDSKITFKDVAGNEEAKKEMMEIVDFLKNAAKYQKLGARIPKGILLIGPSGVGKTLLAKAIAGEAGVPFFSVAGSEFMEMLVGVGSSRVRDLFNLARESQPSLIFIDEIDAIGRQRGMGIGGGHDEREQTLNQILTEMDGFDTRTNVIVISASVTGDTPILIKEGAANRLIPIGDYVDTFYSDDISEGEVDVYGVTALSYKRESDIVKPSFTPVRSVFRHKVDHVYEVEYVGGKIKATGNHSVFVWNGDKIVSKSVIDLVAGDVLVDMTPRVLADVGSGINVENNFEHTIKTYEDKQYDEDFFSYVMQQRGLISQTALSRQTGIPQTTISLWHREVNGPRFLSRNYYKHELPEYVKVTPELMRLLGYYTAEGYSRKEIDFCFNEKEIEYTDDLKYLMEKYFGIKPDYERHITKNAVNIIYSSVPLAHVFVDYCGKGAHNKHVPAFLFDAPFEYFKEYLVGLARGDGHIDKRGHLEVTSVSKQLITELVWLSRMHGMKGYFHSFTAREGRTIKGGRPLPSTTAYRFGMGTYYNFMNDYDRASVRWVPRKSKVRSVKKLSQACFVYDLCGCGNEAFFGGGNPVLLHNTNRPDMLDPALVRPGRFDRRISLPLPDLSDREEIIRIHMRGKPFAQDVKVDRIARKTVGFSGADIENMLNESAILAARSNRTQISDVDLEEAALKVTLGSERRTLQTEEERKITSYHEAGHALVAANVPDMDPVYRVSIVARGASLGHTSFPPERDRYNETKTRLLSIITTILGGRAAEDVVFHELTIGAADDIEKATQLAHKMVAEYGMSTLGPISYNGKDSYMWLAREFGQTPSYSDEMAAKIDNEVKIIIDGCYATAKKVLAEKRDCLDKVSARLLEKETLDGEEFKELLA